MISDFDPSKNLLKASILPCLLFTAIFAILDVAFHIYGFEFKRMSMIEALKVLLVNLAGAVAIVVLKYIVAPDISLAATIIYILLYLLAAELYRFSFRAFYVFKKLLGLYGPGDPPKHVLIISDLDIAELIIRRLLQGKQMEFKPVAVLTDDSGITEKLLGVRVYYGVSDIKALLERHSVGEIVLLAGYYSAKKTYELKDICDKLEVEIKIFEGLHPIVGEEDRLFKKLNLEHLLNRDEITLEQTWIKSFVAGRSVLVTGAAGSIGSEICRQSIASGCSALYALDTNENGLFDLEHELRALGKKIDIEMIVASIRESDRIDSVFSSIKPEICFHAAAHKHVTMMQHHPCEAVKNNVFGTLNVLKACDAHGVRKLIVISTDKAVNPSSVMGATKRVAEMIVQVYGKSAATEVAAVRFGNVLGSNGSVVPLFQKQIENGGPVTVTDPEVERYFMTIQEAVRLVLQAGALAHQGEIFMLDMGKSVKIIELARNMIQLAGLEPDKDIEIEIIGLRQGEKLYEELRMDSEDIDKTRHKSIFVCKPLSIDRAWLDTHLETLRRAAASENVPATLDSLKELTPSIYMKPTIEIRKIDISSAAAIAEDAII